MSLDESGARAQGFRASYDVVVVGAGHAGIEASLAAARMGLKTLVVTQTIESIGRMSCNPSIGGIAKGNIAREVDALGGEMARLIDRTLIQFRMLNASKGPAVQAPRAQADKAAYSALARHVLESTPNLSTLMDCALAVVTTRSDEPLPRDSESKAEGIPGETRAQDLTSAAKSGMRQKVTGLVTERGRVIPARAIVLTTGTFLGGRIFIGEWDAPCGRLGEQAARGLTENLRALGFTTGRLKTGTPPRILRSSINFSALEKQDGDPNVIPFSFDDESVSRPLVPCHVAFTNESTHEIIRANISRSPLYSGKIHGVGPRYCPSIEDKVTRFPQRSRHQIFVEPEGLDTEEIYLNGLSSSLPEIVQDEFLRTMRGFENAVCSRPGYAVEYDYVEPTQLFPSLETKRVAGLFCAGQINGTSGYEEAAGQGIVAGINAGYCARAMRDICGPVPAARENENARAFADGSAAEKQKATDEFNAAQENFARESGFGNFHAVPKWTPLALRRDEAYIGVLIDDLVTLGTKEPYRMFTARAEYRLRLRHSTADRRLARYAFDAGLKSSAQMEKIDARYAAQDEIIALLLKDSAAQNPGYPAREWDEAAITLKYSAYIKKQDARVAKLRRMEDLRIPPDFDYSSIVSLSAESRAKLEKIRPLTLGQAGRISGIRVSDVMLLMVYLK